MYLLSLTLLLAGLFIYAAHRKEWMYGYLLYTLMLYLLLFALEGFIKADPNDTGSLSIFWIFETIIFLLHIPVVLRLSQFRPKEDRVKRAREIFENDVVHMDDHKLHRHLGHK